MRLINQVSDSAPWRHSEGLCDEHGRDILRVSPVAIAAYREHLLADGLARPTFKQDLARIRLLFDYMVAGRILPFNLAASVRAPKHVIEKCKTGTGAGRGSSAARSHRCAELCQPAGSRAARGHGLSFARVSALF